MTNKAVRKVIKAWEIPVHSSQILESEEDPFIKLTEIINKELGRCPRLLLFNQANLRGPIPLRSPAMVWGSVLMTKAQKKKNYTELFDLIGEDLDEARSIHGKTRSQASGVILVPCCDGWLVATDYDCDFKNGVVAEMRDERSEMVIKWMDVDTFGSEVIKPHV